MNEEMKNNKTKIMKCDFCEYEEEMEDFVTSFVCCKCWKKIEEEEQLNKKSYKNSMDLSSHSHIY